MPDPPIPNGSYVILVQDGRAEVARYNEPAPPENPFPSLDHPLNWEELEADALDMVRAAFPGYAKLETSQMFTCPTELVERAIWKL
jgi:hypothetical protein